MATSKVGQTHEDRVPSYDVGSGRRGHGLAGGPRNPLNGSGVATAGTRSGEENDGGHQDPEIEEGGGNVGDPGAGEGHADGQPDRRPECGPTHPPWQLSAREGGRSD